MKTVTKAVAWACIFSTLLMGCYSSMMIDPKGDGRDKIYSDRIRYVVTKDSTKYVFATPPTVSNDAIVGVANNDSVSIPLSSVSEVYVTKSEPAKTMVVLLVGATVVAVCVVLLTNRPSGGHHWF